MIKNVTNTFKEHVISFIKLTLMKEGAVSSLFLVTLLHQDIAL